MDLSKAIEEYLKTLTPKQYKAYEIARDHLRDSFQIEKSNGFLRWVKKNQIAI
jgi:transcriptional regulator CtsR